ncbi:hypothetical protein [Actinobaculum massiliense]|uniref:hypothetical protein n=1 Tax=Actinobaculum massiliense TaxID=202789 RepID=UPI0012DF5115|nr:hypothetical protein [Actinobaculum massiliense]MDK8319461.1 hypothetical protein [Actinobaculum massiliense]
MPAWLAGLFPDLDAVIGRLRDASVAELNNGDLQRAISYFMVRQNALRGIGTSWLGEVESRNRARRLAEERARKVAARAGRFRA